VKLSKQSIDELEYVLAQYEKEKGVIDLDALVTSNCQCTGSHCSNGCSGNKGDIW
jgi:hypothetical protein